MWEDPAHYEEQASVQHSTRVSASVPVWSSCLGFLQKSTVAEVCKPNKLFTLKPLLVKEMNTPGFSSPLLYGPRGLDLDPS